MRLSGYALLLFGTILAGVLFPATLAIVRKEAAMPKRWRLIGGASLIAIAVIVAIAGYLKISLEPDMARQVPYLASAGLATLILVVTGGSLVVADQIRADDERVDEIERAVENLSDLVRPGAESPPRVAASRRKASS